ncbi:lasso peptide biosynthesis PqqD family chaperone [Spirillospora sp. NPDC127200]
MTFALREHVTMTETPHGAVLLDERSGRYWQTNRTGAQALRALLDGASVPEAAEALRERHTDQVGADQARADVTELIDALRAAEVVRS